MRLPGSLLLCLFVLGCGSRSSELVDDASIGDADSPDGDASDVPPDGPPGPECPPYHAKCNGACIPTSVDPQNCGACGVTCDTGAGEVCAAGGCTTTCETGMMKCGGTCVDIKSDNNHCNACDFQCGAGTGCVDGNCQPLVQVGTPPAACAGGGPPVEVEGFPDGPKCIDGVVETTFRWAMCSCKDIELFNPLLTDGYDSTSGPYAPGGLGGGVGLNGTYLSTSTATIGGALWASASAGGVSTSNQTDILQDLHVGGPLTVGNPFTVGGDAYVVGDITTSDSIAITDVLQLPTGSTITGNVTYGSLVRAPVTVNQPCDCDPAKMIPVEGIVAAHRPPNNDNALIGLDPDVLVNPNAALRLELPCGRYYLSSIDTNAPLVIYASGRVALFIDGDILTTSPLTFAVGPSGSLDVFVADRITTSAKMTVGSANYPALTRVYLGGVGTTLTITNDVDLGGFLYLARGKLEASNPLEVFGGIIAGDLRNTGATTIHYDRQVLETGIVCPDATSCDSCNDCGNQACVNGACGACTTSGDCCSPLSCVAGECVLVTLE